MTVGDPRGIGPEIVAKALADPRVGERCDIVVVGPEGAGVTVGESVGRWVPNSEAALAGGFSGLAIERAVEMALGGSVDGIVTAPIDKAALHAGGYDFPGHTEMLASLARAEAVVMMMSAEQTALGGALRVVLATTHLRLADVPSAISHDLIVEQTRITADAL